MKALFYLNLKTTSLRIYDSCSPFTEEAIAAQRSYRIYPRQLGFEPRQLDNRIPDLIFSSVKHNFVSREFQTCRRVASTKQRTFFPESFESKSLV